jgi:hypothetical protein
MFASGFNGVALSASLDEKFLSLFNISGWDTHFL